jgi:hypothetical protein
VAAANHHPKYGRERLWKSLGDPVVHTVLAEDFFVVPMQLDLGWRLEIRTAIFNMTPKIRLNCILKHVIMYVYIYYISYIYIHIKWQTHHVLHFFHEAIVAIRPSPAVAWCNVKVLLCCNSPSVQISDWWTIILHLFWRLF